MIIIIRSFNKKKSSCHLDFTVPADYRMKNCANTWILPASVEKTAEHESRNNINDSRDFRNNPQKPEKEIWMK